MSIARVGLLLLSTLALGCATIAGRPLAELEQRARQCSYWSGSASDPDCMAVADELHRRRGVALRASLAGYLARWTTSGERADPAICRAASEDIRLLESLRDSFSAEVAGVCAQGPTRYGWERCDRDTQVSGHTALVEHGAALLRCGYVDALRPFLDSLHADYQPRFLDQRVAEAIWHRMGTRRMLQYLDEADQEPWQLASVAVADTVGCDTITALRDRGLNRMRALLGARQGCAAVVRAVTDGLGDPDPWARVRACELAYDVPESGLTRGLIDERTRVEREDPFSMVHTSRSEGRSLAFPRSASAIGVLVILPIWLLLDALTHTASTSSTSTTYPVREACVLSSLRKR